MKDKIWKSIPTLIFLAASGGMIINGFDLLEANPKPGELWADSDEMDNPFRDDSSIYEIIAVRDGFVLYRWGRSQFEGSAPISGFRISYDKIPDHMVEKKPPKKGPISHL